MPRLCVVVFYVWEVWRSGSPDGNAEVGSDDGSDAGTVRWMWRAGAGWKFGRVFWVRRKSDGRKGPVIDGKGYAGDAGG